MTDKEEILKLKDGQCYIVPESDYGKAEIWFKNKVYFLFEIPMYGGQPRYSTHFAEHLIDDLIKTYERWT